MENLKGTYWAEEGKQQERVNKLKRLIPLAGEIKLPKSQALNRLRKAQNLYYEIYNNGGGNWANGYGRTLRCLGKRMSEHFSKEDICTPNHRFVSERCIDNLERIANFAINEAWEEQVKANRVRETK